jgi:hypothetical protein
MELLNFSPSGLTRVPEKNTRLRDLRWLAEVELDLDTLEKRWGSPERVFDDLAEWICFAFSPGEGEAFFLQREAENPPTACFGLSVTSGLFTAEVAEEIIKALGIGARVTHVNPEASRLTG